MRRYPNPRRIAQLICRHLILAGIFVAFGVLLVGPGRTSSAPAPPAAPEAPEATQATFSNPTAITIPVSGTATPYPSDITVSGLSGIISGSIKITINNFSHSFTSDVGILLVGPAGSMYVQDGPGVGGFMSNVTYTISDTGPTQLPQNGAWTAGTYRPANYFTDGFPAPAPAGPHANPGPSGGGTATLISKYGGTNPNGVWSLYVSDFNGGNSGSIAGGWTLEITTVSAHTRVLDFDGDGRSDDGVMRLAAGSLQWYTLRSTAGFTGVTWGVTGDTAVPGDYDGDGKWDVAIFRAGVFYILRSSTNSLQAVVFGQMGDYARATQDYDGDGRTDPTVVRSVGANLVFYSLRSTAGFSATIFGGNSNDVPIRGDYDGDGKADIGVYRTSSGTPANTFYILPSGGGPLIGRSFGNFNTDYILPGDFDGDGKNDPAVYRFSTASAGTWYWLRSSDGALASVAFGVASDFPVPGDYDGDGRTDPSVWRQSMSSVFYHLNSTSGFSAVVFGGLSDEPTSFVVQAN